MACACGVLLVRAKEAQACTAEAVPNLGRPNTGLLKWRPSDVSKAQESRA